MDEFFRISQCKSAKDMWEVLEVTHEGTEDVKRSRKHSLIQEYELFKIQPEESIVDVQKRFTHIVNHLTGLGKEFDREELNIKILKRLDRSWQPKVTAISESRDLSKQGTAALFGKLMEHGLELKRLKEQETTERKPKGLALKATEQNEIKEEKEDAEDDETISLLTKRFSKFLKKKSRDRNQQKRRYPKPNDSNSSNYTCFGHGKTGHIKTDCPNNQSKDKSTSKRVERSKGRRAYISWEENEVSSTSSSSTENEENNLCFMMKDEESISDLIANKKNQWYLDSGCSKHMTGDLTKFTSLKLKAEGHVTYGDNNRGRILGRGTVGTRNSTTIENVLYVEGLKHSLLNISQLCDKGYKVNFKSNGCTISSDSSGKDNRLCDACVKGLPKEWKTPRDLTLDNVIGNIEKGVSTRKSLNNFCEAMTFVSQVEPKNLNEALKDSN
ncbi:uncharacterized protein [Phaseolus vulgaris]|uniref:uncharacterized protein n=1 Tax=Phaseolus vulgaris TaxID=3885 RepID=UPI0035C9895F